MRTPDAADTSLSASDEQAIARLLVRYATAIDGRDWPLLRSCFTDDLRADYGDFGAWRSGDEITAFMAQAHADVGPTLHRISNIVVTPAGEGATARSYVDALLTVDDTGAAHRAAGFYEDRLMRAADGWRIAERRYVMICFNPAAKSA